MKIDNSTINEIRNSLDIVDVISNYIPLTSKGKNYFGVCPFHDDHSPSMSVSREKQIYTCFSCGATGNVFKFISDYENISFIEAVKKCADIAGIPLNIGQVKEKTKYKELYEIYELSQKFYQNNINTEKGRSAKQYLYNRNLNDEIIKEFGIGLSLADKDSLTKLLKSKRYDDKTLIRSGLVNENNYELNDVYRNRIMFPLYDLNGKIIGYNGRVYNGEAENKYVNSKETDIFKKRDLLYNYHRAKEEARKKKQIIIMEGPMDIIRAYSIGVKNCVATLGTAFGKEQAMLVRKLSNNVVLCFDGDQAGLKATKTAIEELSKLGIVPKIVRLENNSDPDEYIIKNGKDLFVNKIENAMLLLDFKEKLLKSEFDLNNIEEKANYLNNMIKEIDKIDDDILKELSISKLAKEADIDVRLIKNKLSSKKQTKEYIKPRYDKKTDKYEKSEMYLLYYMLLDKDVIKMYEKKATRINNDKYRELAYIIDLFYKENGYINTADLITYLADNAELIKVVGDLSNLELDNNINYDEIDDYLNNIRKYNEQKQIKVYKNKIKDETDLHKKIDFAKKALEFKIRSEENDR